MSYGNEFAQFISSSPSAFHAAQAVADHLGFPLQSEREPFDVGVGGHTVVRGGAVVSYFIPNNPRGFRIIGAHTDSPGLMLKPQPDMGNQVGVEVYGGPILETWFDRSLTVAGRVVLIDGSERLVNLPSSLLLPNLAIHLGREDIDRQQHLRPVSLIGPIMEAIAADVGVEPRDIAGHELITADSQAAELVGSTFIAGRLDNLTSVFAGMKALEKVAEDSREIVMLAALNHEEVGSASVEGASGTLLEDIIYRIAAGMGRDPREMIAWSSMVSADAAHAFHPNYPHKHDPAHIPLLGGGPVTKLNSKQRYASNAVTVAMWERACEGIAHQHFVSNNNVPCGSTIGPLASTRLGIPTVDVGVPLWAMHSARETVNIDDMMWFTQALEAYLLGD